jgi:hypothetical protein
LPTDTKTIVVPNMLLVRDDLDANLACLLTRTLFDRKPQLEQPVAAAKGISLDTARQTDPVPLHRAAARALDDLGAKELGDESAACRCQCRLPLTTFSARLVLWGRGGFVDRLDRLVERRIELHVGLVD